jgi:multiple sugar transport system substrate-binding protein
LERGVTHDLEFEKWANKIWNFGAGLGSEISLKDFRKDIVIVESRPGHPTKGNYWFPGYNDTEGVRALGFIKDQIDAGITPQKEHFWGKEFLDRKFAVMLEALQHHIPPPHTPENKRDFEQKVGFMPLFPIPDENYTSAALMGGWLLSIPKTSQHKDLAWELITTILEPKILLPI